MLSLILSLISFSTCFVYPLLLTVKALNVKHEKQDQFVKFLFNYWIYYIVLTNVENSLLVKVLDMSMFNLVNVGFFLIKLWLFYCQGCLVMTYYYLDINFTNLEVRFIDPISRLFINPLSMNMLNMANSASGKNNIVHYMFHNLTKFNYELVTVASYPTKTPFFLNYSLNYFCSIDNSTIYRSYKLTNKLLRTFNIKSYHDTNYSISIPQIPSQYIAYGKRVPSRRSSGTKLRHTSNTSNLSNSINSDLLDPYENDFRKDDLDYTNLSRSSSVSRKPKARSRSTSASSGSSSVNNSYSIDQVLNDKLSNHASDRMSDRASDRFSDMDPELSDRSFATPRSYGSDNRPFLSPDRSYDSPNTSLTGPNELPYPI